MASWSIITLKLDARECIYKENERKIPTGLTIDKGIHEFGLISDNRFYAVSFGRYQKLRFERHVEKMTCPKFSGVSVLTITSANDTSDEVTVEVFHPNDEKDGYSMVDSYEFNLLPEENKQDYLNRIERLEEIRPVIEPIKETVPPDAIVTKND